VDGAGTEVLLRNAERIVEAQEGLKEFGPLLHSEKAPSRPELEGAIRAQYKMALVRDPEPRETTP